MNDLDISPAPWSAVEADKFHGEYVIDGNGCTVCDLYFMNNGEVVKHGHNTIANARLIQAAPKMYEILHCLYKSAYSIGLDSEWVGEISDLLSEIRGN